MFGPSPDWVVGVSGLNLCKKDCTWEPSLDIDLYPWDSGTDSGISYMSPNIATQPRERMHKITTKYPEDPRAPFYDTRSDDMTPLAKLFIRREKVIARNCDDEILQSQIVDVAENDDESNNDRKKPNSHSRVALIRGPFSLVSSLTGNFLQFSFLSIKKLSVRSPIFLPGRRAQ